MLERKNTNQESLSFTAQHCVTAKNGRIFATLLDKEKGCSLAVFDTNTGKLIKVIQDKLEAKQYDLKVLDDVVIFGCYGDNNISQVINIDTLEVTNKLHSKPDLMILKDLNQWLRYDMFTVYIDHLTEKNSAISIPETDKDQRINTVLSLPPDKFIVLKNKSIAQYQFIENKWILQKTATLPYYSHEFKKMLLLNDNQILLYGSDGYLSSSFCIVDGNDLMFDTVLKPDDVLINTNSKYENCCDPKNLLEGNILFSHSSKEIYSIDLTKRTADKFKYPLSENEEISDIHLVNNSTLGVVTSIDKTNYTYKKINILDYTKNYNSLISKELESHGIPKDIETIIFKYLKAPLIWNKVQSKLCNEKLIREKESKERAVNQIQVVTEQSSKLIIKFDAVFDSKSSTNKELITEMKQCILDVRKDNNPNMVLISLGKLFYEMNLAHLSKNKNLANNIEAVIKRFVTDILTINMECLDVNSLVSMYQEYKNPKSKQTSSFKR